MKKAYVRFERYCVNPKTKKESLMGAYLQERDDVFNALDGEFDGWDNQDNTYLKISIVEMDEKEYKKLPEFSGY